MRREGVKWEDMKIYGVVEDLPGWLAAPVALDGGMNVFLEDDVIPMKCVTPTLPELGRM